MADKKDCNTGACPVDKKDGGGKLVKSTDLPLLGNPYPPKDVIQNDTPGSLELAVRSVRTTIQPYMSPICTAYNKASDILSIGAAHSQSAVENFRENQGTVTRGIAVAGSGILGWKLLGRVGFFKKLILTSLLVGGTTSVCFPNETKEKLNIAWLITKNKVPTLFQQHNETLVSTNSNKSDEPKQGEPQKPKPSSS